MDSELEVWKYKYSMLMRENELLLKRIDSLEQRLAEKNKPMSKATQMRLDGHKATNQVTTADKLKEAVEVYVRSKGGKISNSIGYIHIYKDFCSTFKIPFDKLDGKRGGKNGGKKKSFLEVIRNEKLINKFDDYLHTLD